MVKGVPVYGKVSDIGWFNPAGEEMSQEHWAEEHSKMVGVFLNGQGIPGTDERGQRIIDESFFLLFNAHDVPVEFVLPNSDWGRCWVKILDTTQPVPKEESQVYQPGNQVTVAERSVSVLKETH